MCGSAWRGLLRKSQGKRVEFTWEGGLPWLRCGAAHLDSVAVPHTPSTPPSLPFSFQQGAWEAGVRNQGEGEPQCSWEGDSWEKRDASTLL